MKEMKRWTAEGRAAGTKKAGMFFSLFFFFLRDYLLMKKKRDGEGKKVRRRRRRRGKRRGRGVIKRTPSRWKQMVVKYQANLPSLR